MFIEKIKPFFSDTDLLGHINHCRLPVWFEHAREPIFRFFTPDLKADNWKLIVARIEVDYQSQLFYGREIELRTGIEKLGNSSFVIRHEALQDGKIAAIGKAVMVNYDYKNQKSSPIPEPQRKKLEEHLVG